MDEHTFLELVRGGECSTVDFKRQAYDLAEAYGKADFVKDVLCMANTPRTGDAYVLIGVEEQDGKGSVVGAGGHPNDADIQNILKSSMSPVPKVDYKRVTVDKAECGAVVVKQGDGGPYFAKKDMKHGVVRCNVLYWRRGSQNADAYPDEQREIWDWFNNGTVHFQPGTDHSWEQFFSAVEGFDKDRAFVLVAGPFDGVAASLVANLGLIDWDLVVDFDPDTETSGARHLASPFATGRRMQHLICYSDAAQYTVGHVTHWLAARGLTDRPNTLCQPGFRKYAEQCGAKLRTHVSRFAAATLKPCTVIILWDDPAYVGFVCTAFNEAFGSRARYVMAVADPGPIAGPAKEYEATVVTLSPDRLLSELGNRYAAPAVDRPAVEYSLPALDNQIRSISESDAAWLEAELEVLFLGTGNQAPPERDTGRDYYRGCEICWHELLLDYDIPRDITARLADMVNADLEHRVTSRINLFHAPGAGGSTVAKRVLWNAHEKFPCVLIQKLQPAESVERLRFVYSQTSRSVLALVEGSVIKESALDDLANACQSRHIPVVFLHVQRRFAGVQERGRTRYLRSELVGEEPLKFADHYARLAPQRRGRLEALARSNDRRAKTPFYFGLDAFERDFAGLSSYVEARLANATPQQRDILSYLALAHHYGQRSINAQMFCSLLGLPQGRAVSLERAIPDHIAELLIRTDGNDWRPAHDLIAEETIEELLCPDMEDRRQWREGLSSWGMRFAEFCRGDYPVVPDDVMETVSRCFLLRDNRELLGTESSVSQSFAQWVEDIPSIQGQLTLLRRLTELFPDEAHFWAHLGRFYSLKVQDYENALVCVDKAIGLASSDHVLRHMKGMVFRKKCYDLMSHDLSHRSKASFTSVLECSKMAEDEFSAARDMAADDEHGYISHIQLITKVVDYAYQISTYGALGDSEENRARFLTSTPDKWIRESLDTAEDLLDQVRRLREGDELSGYEQGCRLEIEHIYGRYETVLQGWDSLLSRKDVYKPPIRRQLVRTYLARCGREWDALKENETKRIAGLLEDNILEQPHEERNLRLWVQAVRRLPNTYTIDAVIERLSYWFAQNDSLECAYYLFVMHSLNAMNGSLLSIPEAKQALDHCKRKARDRRNRSFSMEWLGRNSGLARLVHYSRLGEWDKGAEFYPNVNPLERAMGRIAVITGPEAGQIDLPCGLSAFFVPAKSGEKQPDGRRSGLVAGRDDNKAVTAFIGFSYDGLRAWDVQLAP